MIRNLFVSLLIVILPMALIGFGLNVNYLLFINPLPIIIIPVLGTLYASAITGFRDSIGAVRTAFTRSAGEGKLKRALQFFTTLENTCIVLGIFGTIMVIFDGLRTLEDASLIGAMFASASVYTFLAFLLIVAFVLPCKGMITKRIAAYAATDAVGIAMKKGLASAVVVPVLLIAVILIVFLLTLPGGLYMPRYWWDLWSFTVVPVMGTLYGFAVFGLRNGLRSFKTVFDSSVNRGELVTALNFFSFLGEAYLCITVFCSSISFVNMFLNWSEKTILGPHLAFALLNVVYALLLFVLVIIPFKGILQKRIER
ncbi:hypothetical protein FACS1894130_03640 [Spirochaetia bacterium]|nr:hypothetical protein FACS1894130_03640 [Spirochaetia bacterium]